MRMILFIQSNADDAQISVQVRKKGYRSVQDKELLFFDEIPLSKKSQSQQKIRRAQGLLRLLVRERKLLFNRKYGRFSQIMRWQMWMFVLSPLFLIMFFSLGIIRKFTLATNNLFDVLFYVEFLILFSWSFRRFNHSKQEWNILGSILVGFEYLCWSMAYILSGKKFAHVGPNPRCEARIKIKKAPRGTKVPRGVVSRNLVVCFVFSTLLKRRK